MTVDNSALARRHNKGDPQEGGLFGDIIEASTEGKPPRFTKNQEA